VKRIALILKKKQFYFVFVATQKHVQGFSNALYKGFSSHGEAEYWLRLNVSSPAALAFTTTTTPIDPISSLASQPHLLKSGQSKRSINSITLIDDSNVVKRVRRDTGSSPAATTILPSPVPASEPSPATPTTPVSTSAPFAVVDNNEAPIHVTMYADGASRNNPGEAGSGVWVVKCDGAGNEIPLGCARHYLGSKSTNNQAEYQVRRQPPTWSTYFYIFLCFCVYDSRSCT
jgi:hypothetical protein